MVQLTLASVWVYARAFFLCVVVVSSINDESQRNFLFLTGAAPAELFFVFMTS